MRKQSLKSWGNYPKLEMKVRETRQVDKLRAFTADCKETIVYGNGRSYGDSALNETVLRVRPRNLFLEFDPDTGVLNAEAGILLSEILDVFVPRGWFLRITPGTKLITLGGAIASDVHGKNHHQAGCFSECLISFRLLLPDGELVTCSRETNRELFLATCGGMGLTGVILDARFRLKRIASRTILQTTVKTRNLKETFEAFETHADAPYSVAWIDCLAKGERLGRSLLMFGDFAPEGILEGKVKRRLNIPFFFPSFTLNNLTVRIFNTLYYNKVRKPVSQQEVDYEAFFYPLDSIGNWNRIYGRKGFTQYQFILPKSLSYAGLTKMLRIITKSGKGTFLAVLKLYGPANENYLSFPIEGYSLALDFKIEDDLFPLLERLDELVVSYGGRVYLAKDARISRENFEKGYPQIGTFRELRKKYGMDNKFHSLQSKRLRI